jgi:hypothetical protein
MELCVASRIRTWMHHTADRLSTHESIEKDIKAR